jgi:hypothetical protein
MVGSYEVVLQDLKRRATLTTTRPDMANDKATVIMVTKLDRSLLQSYSTENEEVLKAKGFLKSLRQHRHTYCFAVINTDDRRGLEQQLLERFKSEYLLGRAEHLRDWSMSRDWYEQRSFFASPIELVADLEREIRSARCAFSSDDLVEAKKILTQAKKFILPLESALFKREYQNLTDSTSVGPDAAATVVKLASELEVPKAFQVAHGPHDYFTVAFWEVVPSWTVIAVHPAKKRDQRLPFFDAQTGVCFLAKNLMPPRQLGNALQGALQIGEYSGQLRQGHTWIKTEALRNRFETRSFSTSQEKQMVKLIDVPKGAEIGLF